MTLYILRREHYTVYRYGSLTVLCFDREDTVDAMTILRVRLSAGVDEQTNRAIWEGQ